MGHITRFEEENYYHHFTAIGMFNRLFPSLRDRSSIYLSVIVPAYNEENRLPAMLNESLDYLENRSSKYADFSYEIIIVDDGSSDSTSRVGYYYVKKFGSEKVRVLTLLKNRGKGGAVRLGMLSARGEILLFADADGATKFSDIEKLEEEIENKAVVIGSRAHLDKEATASRSLFRTILMNVFHYLVWLLAVRTVKDTQCGFKMFTREAARTLFYALHVERWAFDVEILYIAEQKKIPMKEVAVNWTEIKGSKLIPVFSWLQMGIDLVLIWFKYQLHIWKIATDSKKEF